MAPVREVETRMAPATQSRSARAGVEQTLEAVLQDLESAA